MSRAKPRPIEGAVFTQAAVAFKAAAPMLAAGRRVRGAETPTKMPRMNTLFPLASLFFANGHVDLSLRGVGYYERAARLELPGGPLKVYLYDTGADGNVDLNTERCVGRACTVGDLYCLVLDQKEPFCRVRMHRCMEGLNWEVSYVKGADGPVVAATAWASGY
jgi:hypothetical protein